MRMMTEWDKDIRSLNAMPIARPPQCKWIYLKDSISKLVRQGATGDRDGRIWLRDISGDDLLCVRERMHEIDKAGNDNSGIQIGSLLRKPRHVIMDSICVFWQRKMKRKQVYWMTMKFFESIRETHNISAKDPKSPSWASQRRDKLPSDIYLIQKPKFSQQSE